MDGKQIVTTLDLVLQWITRLAWLNILWFMFSIFGLFVAGVFPATVATLGVARKWLKGDHELKVWKTFNQIYRQELVSANIIGWILAFFGGLLYFNYRVILQTQDKLPFYIPFAFYLLVFFYLIVVIWAFPLLVHFQAKWSQHMKNAIIIGLTKIQYTFFAGIYVFAVFYFSLEYPGFIPFFTISLSALGWMWVTMRVFLKING
ncbi:YesL family protein [Aquibacillus salsiterrae]|uniref:YesL family protein n=1 Tax=Aquibacillus salsiterrae TaxID=2950439 RepID=A0A9X4AEG7_9BACI|nr:YesL family protein [Aquibacillus salsiterrae]MDC3416872.1 YesL family protein [Aquibacillus salsiterrae]